MTIQERAEFVVIDNMSQSLEYLQSELDDIGVLGLDLVSVKEQLIQIVRDKYADKSVDAAEGLLREFGVGETKTPMPLARSFACFALRNWLNDLVETVKTLEEAEDDKLSDWVKRTFGKSAKLDFNSLRVVEGNDNEELIKLMSTIYQVLNYDNDRLQRVVSQIKSDADGLAAFVRDLGSARLADDRVAQVLSDLLDVEDPKVIDQVVNSAELKTNPEHKAIYFMGELLKKRLERELKDEEWQTLGEDEDEEAA